MHVFSKINCISNYSAGKTDPNSTDNNYFRQNLSNQDRVVFSGSKNKEYKSEIKRLMGDLLPKRPDLRQEELDNALRSMGEKFLKKEYRENYTKWTKEIPTTGFCYTVTEFAHYFVNSNTKEYVIKYNDGTTHWFLEKPDGKKIDFSLSQFRGEDPEYHRARRGAFMTNFPSKRACEIAVRLGIISRETANQIPKIAAKLKKTTDKEEEKVIIRELKGILNKTG